MDLSSAPRKSLRYKAAELSHYNYCTKQLIRSIWKFDIQYILKTVGKLVINFIWDFTYVCKSCGARTRHLCIKTLFLVSCYRLVMLHLVIFFIPGFHIYTVTTAGPRFTSKAKNEHPLRKVSDQILFFRNIRDNENKLMSRARVALNKLIIY